MIYCYLEAPVGRLLIAADDAALRDISFATSRHRRAPDREWKEGLNAVLQKTVTQLSEYFAGNRRAFDVPLGPTGTQFQLRVWNALLEIPFGDTASYSQIAARIGRPSAVRAVGSANGRNPIPIIIPCHRIIGSNGALTGFGGGLDVKQSLLLHERDCDRAHETRPCRLI
ncbi:MAG: methylated-DNA--[protein]-cysteine S-methyltransferase [Sphingorhabdus sp.]|uniref:methylated-DNA--[protein]-cysteine S-methyltransferase n=1 Tax=Sphingorhabdus sp. TaxID=1902408 RepID=UPI003C82E536